MKYTVKSDRPYSIKIEKKVGQSDQFKIDVNGNSYHIQIKEFHANGRIKTLAVDNEVIPIDVLKHADGFPRMIYLNGLPFDVEVEKIKSLQQSAEPAKPPICSDLKSGLPGQVLAVLVEKGDSVEEGQSLVILESMKMENEIRSPKNGVVSAIFVEKGQVVVKDERILTID